MLMEEIKTRQTNMAGEVVAMPWEGRIFRPPSESDSLILQVTVGCSHNKCIFCESYRDKHFRAKTLQEIRGDVELVKRSGVEVKKVFLADGDALCLPVPRLAAILAMIREAFPGVGRVSLYGTARQIVKKGARVLQEMRQLGLGMIYLGVESGDDELLWVIRKGSNAREMVEAADIAREAGVLLSTTVIAGLGGVARSRQHAEATAALLSRMDPRYISVLTLMVVEGTPLYEMVHRGQWTLLTPLEVLRELYWLLEGLEVTESVFRTNHASNYLPLRGNLPQDKEKLLRILETVLRKEDRAVLRPEEWRTL